MFLATSMVASRIDGIFSRSGFFTVPADRDGSNFFLREDDRGAMADSAMHGWRYRTAGQFVI